MTTVDHDPRELPHRWYRIIAIITGVLTLAASIPVYFGLRWFVDGLSETALAAIFFLMIGTCGGFFYGRANAYHEIFPERETRTQRFRRNFVPLVKYSGWLALRWPLAIFILPAKSWRHARSDGDGLFSSLFHAFSGFVFGLCLTMLCVVPLAIAVTIATGH
ncbi:MAG TPA: hypothetical protein VN112_16225 [Ensifer sp.]|nr:hypothetical protein [Ensifer sp.]